METTKPMNWDWEKLQEQQKKRKSGGGDGDAGGSGGGNGGIPPQMEDFLNRFKGGNFSWVPVLVVLVIVAIVLGSSMVYKVEQFEVGVVQQFGQYHRTTTPGLHFKLPRGIETVTKVPVKRVFREEFGFSTGQTTKRGSLSSENRLYDSANVGQSLMLTGDLNVGVVPWIVQYKIKDARKFLFEVEDVRSLLMDMSEAAMRLVVGDRSIDEILTERAELANQAQKILQEEMDEAQSGIFISQVELKKTNVPPEVQSSFNRVNQALQEKEQMIQEARKEYNQAVPAARGEADRVVKAAEGYAVERVNKAQGDTKKFIAIYNEYKSAKEITRRRLYLETMAKVLPRLGEKYIVDSKQNNLLPLLNLGQGKEVK